MKLSELKPNVILLDLGLRSQNSLQVVEIVKKDFPEYFQIQQGVKKRRNKLTLTRSEKMANKRIAKQRIVIEHIFSCIKKYQVLATKYRHDFKSHNQDFRNIAALVNFRHGFSTTS